MHTMSTTDIILVITTISTALCSVIAAWKSNSSNNTAIKSNEIANLNMNKVNDNANKLDVIHNLTNGSLTKVTNELLIMRDKYDNLLETVNQLLDTQKPGALQTAMDKVEK